MNFWTDLIWVGNTLLPRWFVFGCAVAIALIVAGSITWLVAR